MADVPGHVWDLVALYWAALHEHIFHKAPKNHQAFTDIISAFVSNTEGIITGASLVLNPWRSVFQDPKACPNLLAGAAAGSKAGRPGKAAVRNHLLLDPGGVGEDVGVEARQGGAAGGAATSCHSHQQPPPLTVHHQSSTTVPLGARSMRKDYGKKRIAPSNLFF